MQLSNLALLSLPALALAAGSATVKSLCSAPVYLWSVGSSVSGPFTINSTRPYSEPYRRDPTTGGIALKITKTANGLTTPGTPQTVLAYTLDTSPPRIWYDLSDVFGDAFAGSKLTITTDGGSACPTFVWATGTPPAGSTTGACDANANVTLTLCAA